MRILIDESLPRHLKQLLPEQAVFTVQDMGWAGIKNGALLKKANDAFDVLLTADQNLRFQQNLRGLDLALVVFPSNRLAHVIALTPRLREVLATIASGALIEL